MLIFFKNYKWAVITLSALLWIMGVYLGIKLYKKAGDDIVALVASHLPLPQDEKPTIATVTDPELLKDQPFFAAAKNGHKVLIYSRAKKAILYDPKLDAVISVAPLSIK